MTPHKTLLTLREMAAALSISWRHLQNLTKKRAIPCVRLGYRVLYDPVQVHAAIDRNHTVRAI